MSFVYPSFLFALFTLSIPVIIHFFNLQKDKVVWFTQLKFLKEVKESSSRRRKLKHWLILLCRVLFLTMLVFLFAQPFIPGTDKTNTQKETLVSIYLDNSQSMTAENSEGPLFYQGLKKAEEIISGFTPQTKFQLLTNEYKAGSHTVQSSRKILSRLAEVKISQIFRSMESVYQRQLSFFSQQKESDKYIFWLSDFNKSTAADLTKIQPDTSISFFMIPLQSASDQNLYVDSVYTENPFIRPGTRNRLYVRLVNEGSKEVKNLTVRMMLDSLRAGTSQLTIPPKGKGVAEFNFTVYDDNWKKGTIEFDDNPIAFDNNYFFSFKPSRNINIAYIYEGAEKNYMKKVFSSDSVFHFRSFSYHAIDYSYLEGMNLIILDGVWNPSEALSVLLLKHIERGGALSIFPPKEVSPENLTTGNTLKTNLFFTSFFDKISFPSPVWKSGLEGNQSEIKNFSSEEDEDDSTYILNETSDESVTDYSNLAPVHVNASDFWEGVFDISAKGKAKKGALTESMDMPRAVARIRWENSNKVSQQPIIKFRNDEPYFSVFNAENGKIYLFASEIQSKDCNLALHALFVPMVYKMAISSIKNIPIAWSLQYPIIEIPISTAPKEAIIKLKGNQLELIPQSRISGGKLYLDIPREITQAGHYLLSGIENTIVSLNAGKEESQLSSYTKDELKAIFPNTMHIHFPEVKEGALKSYISEYRWGKPLWEYCLMGCLFFLLGEVLLIRFWK